MLPPAGHKPSYYKYMALLPEKVDRDALKRRLKDEFGVALAGEVYATPCHLQPLWAKRPGFLAREISSLPNSELAAKRQICLPIYPGLTSQAQGYVIDSLKRVL